MQAFFFSSRAFSHFCWNQSLSLLRTSWLFGMGTFFETTVRLIAPGSNALVRALAVRIQVSSRFLCSTKAWRTICGELFLSRRTSLLWKSRKSLLNCMPRGYLPVSPHIGIFEVLLLTPAVHFSSERCRRSMQSFANCVSVSLSDCVFF